MTFVEAYRAGLVTAQEVDDYVEEWHNAPEDGVPLHEFLGMNTAMYAAWLARPCSLAGLVTRQTL